jgi:hypothetical protein
VDYQERFQTYKAMGRATRMVKAYCMRKQIKSPEAQRSKSAPRVHVGAEQKTTMHREEYPRRIMYVSGNICSAFRIISYLAFLVFIKCRVKAVETSLRYRYLVPALREALTAIKMYLVSCVPLESKESIC